MQYSTVLIKMKYACTHYETGQGSSLDARFSTSFIFSNNIYDRLRSASRLKSASFPNAQIYGRFIYYGQDIHHWTSIWESEKRPYIWEFEKRHRFENWTPIWKFEKKDIDLRYRCIGRRSESYIHILYMHKCMCLFSTVAQEKQYANNFQIFYILLCHDKTKNTWFN